MNAAITMRVAVIGFLCGALTATGSPWVVAAILGGAA